MMIVNYILWWQQRPRTRIFSVVQKLDLFQFLENQESPSIHIIYIIWIYILYNINIFILYIYLYYLYYSHKFFQNSHKYFQNLEILENQQGTHKLPTCSVTHFSHLLVLCLPKVNPQQPCSDTWLNKCVLCPRLVPISYYRYYIYIFYILDQEVREEKREIIYQLQCATSLTE